VNGIGNYIFSTLHSVADFVLMNPYEMGLGAAEFFVDRKVGDIENELEQKIRLARAFLKNSDAISNSNLPEKVREIWASVSHNPQEIIRKGQWKRVWLTGARVLPLLGYTLLFSRVIGFASVGKTAVCVLTPVFSRIVIALANQAKVPTDLLERIDRVVWIGFETLNGLFILLKKGSESSEEDRSDFSTRFSIYMIDLIVAKGIDFIAHKSLFDNCPFGSGIMAEFHVGGFKNWTEYFSLNRCFYLWMGRISKLCMLFLNQSQLKEINERIRSSHSEESIGKELLERYEWVDNPLQDDNAWLCEEYIGYIHATSDKDQRKQKILENSWRYLSKETELEVAKALLLVRQL